MKMQTLRLIALLLTAVAGHILSAADAITVPDGKTVVLENRCLKREWSCENGVLRTAVIVNKAAGGFRANVSGDEFRLRVSAGTDIEGTDRILTAADFKLAGSEVKTVGGTQEVTFHLENPELKVELKAWLSPDDFYLRKQLSFTAVKPITIEQIDVESLNLTDAGQPYQLDRLTATGEYKADRPDAGGDFHPNLGQPLYGNQTGTFWGLEFPAAVNTVSKGTLSCAYLYGRELGAGQTYCSYPSVMGVADDPKYVKDAFFDYIDRIRIRPFHLQVQYNSWLDHVAKVTSESFNKSVGVIHDELVTKRGVRPLDTYVIDDGWEDCSVSWADKYWKVNKKFDPDFAKNFQAVGAAKSHLGLWMNPACVFGAEPAVPQLRKDGFEALGKWMSLAGPKHMAAFEERMAELTRQGVAFYKLDGIFGHLNTREFELHGSRYGLPELPQLGAGEFSPGDPRLNDPKYDELKLYYITAGTELLIRNFQRMATLNPNVYIVISNASYLSPWWLQHVDAVWMNNAGDFAPRGTSRTGQLVYRDSRLYQIAVTENTQFPLNAVFNHEPIKLKPEDPEVFRRYLYMSLSRGTGLLDLYLKPAMLTPPDWDVLAEGLFWTDLTGAAFKRARMHGGNPHNNEVYGFTGWLKDCGYISIHNPSEKAATYKFTLDRAFGLHPGSGPFVLSSPFADSLRGLKPNYAFGDTVEISLDPREVRILNFSTTPLDWSRVRAMQEQQRQDSPRRVSLPSI